MSDQVSHLSVFDLDHTLFVRNSSSCFSRYLRKQRIISWQTYCSAMVYYLWHKTGLLPLSKLHEKVFQNFFKGMSLSAFEHLLPPFVELAFQKLLYPPAVFELSQAKQNHHYTLLLSSSPCFLVQPIAARFGMSGCEATHYAVDHANCFSHLERLVDGKSKASIVHELAENLGVAKERVTAYSDSILDLPLLKSVGTAVGVNPDRRLRLQCQKSGWRIL